MQNTMVKAKKRNEIGGGHVKRLRKEAVIPAVVYGKGIKSTPIKLSLADLRELVTKSGKNAFFTLELDGEEHAVIIKDIQYDVVNSEVLHVDLQKVSLTEKIQSSVTIRIVGREKVETGRKVLMHQLDELSIECLPQDSLNHIDVDVSGLGVGDSLTVGDLEVPERIEILNDPDEVIVSLSEVREIIEEEPEEETDILEPKEIEGEQEEEGQEEEEQE